MKAEARRRDRSVLLTPFRGPAAHPDGARFTGATRDDWAQLLARLTDGFVRSIPPGGSPARASLPGAPPHDQIPAIEGFGRMSVAWGAWLHEPTNPATLTLGRATHDVSAILARGLVDATDPSSAAWWGPIGDRDQRIVEAAEIATAVWLGRSRLRAAIDAIDRAAFDRVLDWLGLVDGRDVWPDNWVLFPMASALVRRAAGRTVDLDAVDAALDWMAAHHVGDGWSSDGAGHALDLYSGWAINWHLLWWVAIDGDRRPALRATIIRRARAWLRFTAALAADDGAFPRFGRSLGYRFAIAAPFAQAALLGIDPLPRGVAGRIAARLVRHSLDEDAIDPTTDWFRIGVGGERPEVVERYMSAGAVAWAAHAFVGLGLPPSHPYWAAADDPGAARRSARAATLAARGAGLLASRNGSSTTLHNARSGHPSDIPGHDYAATYGKLAYRSHFPFDVPVGAASAGSDDTIVAIEPDDEPAPPLVHRNESVRGSVGPSWIRTDYRLPTRRPSFLRTIVLLVGDLEVRISRVVPCSTIRLREGGAALGTDEGTVVDIRQSPDGDTIALSDGPRVVAIRRLGGYDSIGVSTTSGDRVNLVHDRSIHPWVEETNPSRSARLVASATIASASPVEAMASLGAVTFREIGNDKAEIDAESPRTVARVALGRRPPTSIEFAGLTFRGPSLRIAVVTGDGTSIAGERIESVSGVLRLSRPGVVAITRNRAGVEATVAAGLVLDERWAGPDLGAVRVRDGADGFGDPIPLEDSGIAPDELVRRLARRAGTHLVTLRFERRR